MQELLRKYIDLAFIMRLIIPEAMIADSKIGVQMNYFNGNSYETKDQVHCATENNELNPVPKLLFASVWDGLFDWFKKIGSAMFTKGDNSLDIKEDKDSLSPKKRIMEYEKELIQNPYNKKYKVYN